MILLSQARALNLKAKADPTLDRDRVWAAMEALRTLAKADTPATRANAMAALERI